MAQVQASDIEAQKRYVEFLAEYVAEQKDKYQWTKPIQGLIAEMRSQGYDRRLRAGTSLYRLILSRSRKHGLQSGQAALYLDFSEENGMTIYYSEKPNDTIQINIRTFEMTTELEQLIDRLLAQPIN